MRPRPTIHGFTLIELMIVVAIIGILAAIAIPNFLKFQARSKQSEVRANLKGYYNAQEAFFQEHDHFALGSRQAGFIPERGNRYTYYLGSNGSTCANFEDRSTVTGSQHNDDDCITADTFKFSTAGVVTNQTYGGTGSGQLGVTVLVVPTGFTGDTAKLTQVSETASGSFMGSASGNVDSEMVGIDGWFIGTLSGVETTVGCGVPQTAAAVPAGTPGQTYNDVECD